MILNGSLVTTQVTWHTIADAGSFSKNDYSIDSLVLAFVMVGDIGSFISIGAPTDHDLIVTFGVPGDTGSFVETSSDLVVDFGLLADIANFVGDGGYLDIGFSWYTIAETWGFIAIGNSAVNDLGLVAETASFIEIGSEDPSFVALHVTLLGSFIETGNPLVFGFGLSASAASFRETGKAFNAELPGNSGIFLGNGQILVMGYSLPSIYEVFPHVHGGDLQISSSI